MGDHAQGRVEQSNFDDYQVVRIDGAPTATYPRIVEQGLEVPSSSVGEPSVPPIGNQLA